MGEIIFGWVLLSFICGLVLSGKKSGFWGTFFLCLLLSPLLGVIISVASGNKEIRQTTKQIKTNKKQELLKEIETLKKEEELDLISEEGKIELEKLIERYKNYDKWQSLQQKNIIREREEQSRSGWISVFKSIAVIFILLHILGFFFWKYMVKV